MELNRDELRRQVRDLDLAQRAAEADQNLLADAIVEEVPEGQRGALFLPNLDRRNFLRAGGIGVAALTLLAACREKGPKVQLPISGENPGYTALASQPVNDVVLLRTAASFEYSVIDAYKRVLDNGFITDSVFVDLIKLFSEHHAAHAEAMAAATTALGGTACTKLNPKITSYVIEPLLLRIANSGPDQAEDVKALAFSLESIAAATYQGVVPVLTTPALRAAAMSVGSVEARHAAVLGMIINPTDLVPTDAKAAPAAAAATTTTTVDAGLPTTLPAETTTTVTAASVANSIHAIPTAFGSLAPVPLTVGPANENGVRATTNLETPSLNSFLYEDEAC